MHEEREFGSWSFSPDGRRMVYYVNDKDRHTLQVWDGELGDPIVSPTISGDISNIEFSADGKKLLVSTGDGISAAWDIGTGKQIGSFKAVGATAEFSPSGQSIHFKFFAASNGSPILRIVSANATGDLPTFNSNNLQHAMFLSMNKNPQIAAVQIEQGQEPIPEIRSIATGEVLGQLKGHRKAVDRVVIVDNGRRAVSSSDDKNFRIWDLQTGATLASVHSQIVFVGEKWMLARVNGTDLDVWDVHSGALHHRVKNVFIDDVPNWSFFSSDGSVLFVVRLGSVSKLLNVEDGRELLQLSSVKWASFLSKERLSVWFGNGDLGLIDVRTGEFIAKLHNVMDYSFSSDGHFIAVFDGKFGYAHDASTGMELLRFPFLPAPEAQTILTSESNVEISSDGRRLIAKKFDGSMDLWDLNSQVKIEFFTESLKFFHRHFDQSGKRFVTTDTNTAVIWSSVTGDRIVRLPEHHDYLSAIKFSNDGREVLTASADGETRVFDSETGRLIASLKGSEQKIVSAQFSPDGTRIITKSADETIHLWNKLSAEEIGTFKSPSYDDASTIFSPDADRFVLVRKRRFAPGSDTINLWDFKGRLIANM